MSENRDILQKQAARIAELEETVRRKQALAEERQELINTWQAAKEQAETANQLASEKDRTIATLADKLSQNVRTVLCEPDIALVRTIR